MFDTTKFEALDAAPIEVDAVVLSTSPAPNAPKIVLPATLKAVAESLGVVYDTLRNKWIGKIEAIYNGLNCDPIRDESKRVTAFGYEAISGYVESVYRNGMTEKVYENMVHQQFQPLPQTKVEREVLPPIDRTAAGSLVPTGSKYLNALEEEEAQLKALEAQELALLGRMQGNLDRLTQNQTQWERTNDLRRQRLLRQTRLEAAALATELEAEFDETLRESQYNIRRGTLGKPVAAPQSHSA